MKEKLYIYTRVSTQIQEEKGSSLQEQKRIGVELSKKLDMKPVVYNEGGKSSFSEELFNRPKMCELYELLNQGLVKHLYCWNMDRISRKTGFWDQMKLILIKYKVKLYTKDGQYNIGDNLQERMMFQIMNIFTEYDNELRRLRSCMGKLNKVKDGFWYGSTPPYGYKVKDKRLVVNEDQKKWIETIYKMYLKGSTYRDINKFLFMKGVKSPSGNERWGDNSIKNILNLSHYVGWFDYTDKLSGTTVKGSSPKILDQRLWDKVQIECNSRDLVNKVRYTNTKKDYMLDGLVYCKECGDKYSVRHQKRIRDGMTYTYYCKDQVNHIKKHKHENRWLNGKQFEDLVWDTTVEVLTNSHHWKELEKGRILTPRKVRKDEINRLTRKVVSLEKDNQKLKENVLDINNMMILTDVEKRKFLKKTEFEILKNREEINEINEELDTHEKKDQWVDWVKKYKDTLSTLSKKSEKIRREFLDGVVSKVEVRMETRVDHEVIINYTLPIVNDKYERLGSSRGKKSVPKVVDGVTFITRSVRMS